MDIPLNEVVYFDAVTHHPTTGAVTDADSTPTFEVFEESTDTDIGVGGNLTKRTSKTGNYRGSFTASAANGFEAGKWYNVIASATVNSIAGKAVVMRFRIVVAETTAGQPIVDATGLFTSQMTEAYASDGTAPTLAQMMFMLWSSTSEFAISGTTITAKKLDGSTAWATWTLDSSTAPTSRTRAT